MPTLAVYFGTELPSEALEVPTALSWNRLPSTLIAPQHAAASVLALFGPGGIASLRHAMIFVLAIGIHRDPFVVRRAARLATRLVGLPARKGVLSECHVQLRCHCGAAAMCR